MPFKVECRCKQDCCWVEVNLATLTYWGYYQLLNVGVSVFVKKGGGVWTHKELSLLCSKQALCFGLIGGRFGLSGVFILHLGECRYDAVDLTSGNVME